MVQLHSAVACDLYPLSERLLVLTADLPDLPASAPEWLASVVRGLVKSDHCEAERRLSPKEAIMMLEVEGIALAWSKLEQAQKQASDAQQQLVVLQQQVELDRHMPQTRQQQQKQHEPAEGTPLRFATLTIADMQRYDSWFTAESGNGLPIPDRLPIQKAREWYVFKKFLV